ncbi:MAG: PilT/PilU family type 4a pilus ATPase [Deltaproteobacteria bacterium]|nr:PilT/PilU family type 4a pilus ATPase [Deltaproteobacteria bacterium]
MQTLALDADMHARVAAALAQSPLFSSLSPDVLGRVAERGVLGTLEPGEALVHEGDESDSFAVLLAGELRVNKLPQGGGEAIELTRMLPPESVGEMGLLLGQPRSATVVAGARALVLRFDREAFGLLYERVPGFGLAVSRGLAARLALSSKALPLPVLDVAADPEVMALLPVDFITRHRALPLKQEGNRVWLGFVDDVSPRVLRAAKDALPGMELVPVRVSSDRFDAALADNASVPSFLPDPFRDEPQAKSEPAAVPRLDALLRRVVSEGASDLHLSGGQKPRWRLDGEIHEMSDAAVLGEREVFELLRTVMDERALDAYEREHDVDFAYALGSFARFRINLFRDKGGAGAVLRQIPAKILTFEQLNLPPVAQRLCEQAKGLVLVTGPTGSGKSTTLAAMIDGINKTRRAHIITLEDPIEFVHTSQRSLINQREVGSHTKSFARALKAALREDPDIVLVGEMRDLETMQLALETANTGHLVFGTLHTSTAISTVDRIVDVFPAGQQEQVRSVLADTIKGVLAQALCRKVGGGRVAAIESLVVSYAVANLIREGKTHQLASTMSTSKAQGNVLLNDALAQLVNGGVVEYEEALSKAVDKADLARRCNKPPPGAQPAG